MFLPGKVTAGADRVLRRPVQEDRRRRPEYKDYMEKQALKPAFLTGADMLKFLEEDDALQQEADDRGRFRRQLNYVANRLPRRTRLTAVTASRWLALLNDPGRIALTMIACRSTTRRCACGDRRMPRSLGTRSTSSSRYAARARRAARARQLADRRRLGDRRAASRLFPVLPVAAARRRQRCTAWSRPGLTRAQRRCLSSRATSSARAAGVRADAGLLPGHAVARPLRGELPAGRRLHARSSGASRPGSRCSRACSSLLAMFVDLRDRLRRHHAEGAARSRSFGL